MRFLNLALGAALTLAFFSHGVSACVVASCKNDLLPDGKEPEGTCCQSGTSSTIGSCNDNGLCSVGSSSRCTFCCGWKYGWDVTNEIIECEDPNLLYVGDDVDCGDGTSSSLKCTEDFCCGSAPTPLPTPAPTTPYPTTPYPTTPYPTTPYPTTPYPTTPTPTIQPSTTPSPSTPPPTPAPTPYPTGGGPSPPPVPPTPPPPTPTPTPPTPTPPTDDDMWGDPHMRGLRGQSINWSGVDGGWYSLIKDDSADLNVNVRVTAPLPDEFPNRQLMTSLAVLSEGHSLVIEVANPYTTDTDGCPEEVSPCLSNGGLRIIADGQEVDELLQFSREMPVADGAMTVSASNLPVECRQFGGHKIWARMHQEMLDGRRELLGGESLEEWILRYDHAMAAPDWCNKYIAENDLADLQSIHAIFKIETSTVTVRLNAGVNYQGDGDVDGDGRVLPDLEFWQMDIGLRGVDLDNPALSGLLGETARPVYDENGQAVMKGFRAFRGSVEDYRVSGALGVHFPLLDEKEEGHE